MKSPILFILLCLSLGALAQNPAKLSRSADSAYKAKNYPLAAMLYIQSADVYDFKASKRGSYYNAACCYALAGNSTGAMNYLKLALQNGYTNISHIKQDADLNSLHALTEWQKITGTKIIPTSTNDPYKAKLVTTDIKNFWDAYDRAQKDTANRLAIYKNYYIDKGTAGLQDYFGYKVRYLRQFVKGHDQRPAFYSAIRKNTYAVDAQKKQMQASFVNLKRIYPQAQFPDIYFVIGNFTSGGTSTENGLLIGLDQAVRTPDIPTGELGLWERNNFTDLKALPHLIAHELIHFQQDSMANDTTLLAAAIREGMADYLAELISDRGANDRLHVYAKGREGKIWAAFKKEMYLDRASNWIANSDQETPDHPADLGYWVGYQICKAYYNQSADKQQAVYDMLHIKNYRAFYDNSKADALFL